MIRLPIRQNHKQRTQFLQNAFLNLYQERAIFDFRQGELLRFAHTLDSTIRKALKDLAKAKWPAQRWLGMFPVSSQRIRCEVGQQKVIWWVEQDIPPYELYRCEAYFVELEMDAGFDYVLTVRSGNRRYFVEQADLASIEQILAKAALNPPVIIPRCMGSAFE